MVGMPAQPKIYHITHVDNLPHIVADGYLCSDANRIAQGKANTNIGLVNLKSSRLALPVTCHQGTRVGDYVPFYFCPRSIMLFVIHMANNPGLAYRGGQGPIVHLEADLATVINAATKAKREWAFTTSNAGARYTAFYSTRNDLGLIDWASVGSNDFRQQNVKEAKQAEFLVHDIFPWSWVERIGVKSKAMQAKVEAALQGARHKPQVAVNTAWYY